MRLLALKELKAAKGVPYGKTSLYRMMANHEFPLPIQLGPNRVAWIESDIDDWIREKAATRSMVAA
jgi:prophage regulatory protein